MTLYIDSGKQLVDIQAAFQKEFPFLKIAFFTKAHAVGESSYAKDLISNKSKTVSDLNPDCQKKNLVFDANTKVQELETAFENEFGLHVQVFRKSGSVWLETSATDQLTLGEQSEKAAEFEGFKRPAIEPLDYREQD